MEMGKLTKREFDYIQTRKAIIEADQKEAQIAASKALWESYDSSWLADAEQAQQRARKARLAKEVRRQVKLEAELSTIELDL
mgnify:CR=1 FL=1